MLPDTINGLPLHALAVHASVVLVPLAAVLGLVFAVPKLRRWSLVPLPLLAVGAAVSTWVSTQSGEALMQVGGLGAAGLGGPVADLVERHEELGKQLFLMTIAYAVVSVLAAAVATRSGGASRVSANVLAVVLVVGAVVVGFQTYRVGDAGAEAVWNPTGNTPYSTD